LNEMTPTIHSRIKGNCGSVKIEESSY
jgi:hypothetical protein